MLKYDYGVVLVSMYSFYLFDFFSIFSFGEERENMALGQSWI